MADRVYFYFISQVYRAKQKFLPTSALGIGLSKAFINVRKQHYSCLVTICKYWVYNQVQHIFTRKCLAQCKLVALEHHRHVQQKRVYRTHFMPNQTHPGWLFSNYLFPRINSGLQYRCCIITTCWQWPALDFYEQVCNHTASDSVCIDTALLRVSGWNVNRNPQCSSAPLEAALLGIYGCMTTKWRRGHDDNGMTMTTR